MSQRAVEHYLRPGTLNLPALPPLALYVHLPWCLKKCPYCDFNSHELSSAKTGAVVPLRFVPGPAAEQLPRATDPQALGVPPHGSPASVAGGAALGDRLADAVPQAGYLQALRADLEAALPLVWGRPVVSVFIGGGTPSLFSPDSIDCLLADIRALLPLQPRCEITLEANPGTFERERFRAYRAAGVTRLSIGVQSFDDASLNAIGRVHDGQQARDAIEEARSAFDTFNIDLMYALPGQT